MRRCPPLVAALAALLMPTARAQAPFTPRLAGSSISVRSVRPGRPFSLTLRWRNAGGAPATGDYRAFVHVEPAETGCAGLLVSGDHALEEPTSSWRPGATVMDGPMVLSAPTSPARRSYRIHVGLFDLAGDGHRVLDTFAGEIEVSPDAPPTAAGPAPMPVGEQARARAALANRTPAARAVSLAGTGWAFTIDRTTGTWQLRDTRTNALWTSSPDAPGLATVILRNGSRTAVCRLDRFGVVRRQGAGILARATPVPEGRGSGPAITFTIDPVAEPAGIRIAYSTRGERGWQVAGMRLLDHAFTVTETGDGRFYVPNRLGIELIADHELPSNRSWLTYNDLAMAMCGAQQGGSALLVNWSSVDGDLVARTRWLDGHEPAIAGRRAMDLTLSLPGPSGSCTVHPLGRGNYVQVARAYRPLARAKGWLKTWVEKRKTHPSVDRILGATDFKPFVFNRLVASSVFNTRKVEETSIGFTFDEAAAAAEHWRKDLQVDRAYVVLAGWVNGGYDVRHPDPLPAAPEIGGNAGLIDAAKRIKGLGYLFGLHDNYQDMYEDAPSWGRTWLNKDARGVARMGGNWAGGQAWQVCAIKQVELAERPRTNLPEIARLFGPSIYFIDTVFAWPLVTCEDPAHPMTRADDLTWKSRLSNVARNHFGLFGSEEGREWAVPCADYLEGIFGHQADSPVGASIPLFQLVYHDCVQIMTHQGDRIGPGDEKKVADHILYAQMPVASFGNHKYWLRQDPGALPVRPLAPDVRQVGPRRIQVTYRWQVQGPVKPGMAAFVHCTSERSTHPEKIAFQDDHDPSIPTGRWQPGTIVSDGPRTVEVPAGVEGDVEVHVGLLLDGQRAALAGVRSQGGRYRVGTLKVHDNQVTFAPAALEESRELWSRGDGGWGQSLGATDRVIKNTWEVLSPLNRMTADTPMSDHLYLRPDGSLQQARYGSTTVTVAYGKPADLHGTKIPAYGFLVESPTYIAFCATRFGGIAYSTPTLFTIRSLDGKPIAASGKVRIYHGFGDPRLSLFGKWFRVERESVVEIASPMPAWRTALYHLVGIPGMSALRVRSRFFGYRSAVDRPTTDGEAAYDYSVHIIRDRSMAAYRMYSGGRWLRRGLPGADGDHVLQHVSQTGAANTWAMPHDRPEFLIPFEEGHPEVWYAGNCLEPEVVKVAGAYYMFCQVQGSEMPALPGDQEPRRVDRILLFTGKDGSNWSRQSTQRGVVVNLDEPERTQLHHQEVIYVPWDRDGKPWWMYVCADRPGQALGYSRLRSAYPTTFDWRTRDAGVWLAQLGNQTGYLRHAPTAPLFLRITFGGDATGRQVPMLHFSADGLKWRGDTREGAITLDGSKDNARNPNCYFLGISTLDGTGEFEQVAPGRFRAIYGATTCRTPVAPEIFESEIGVGEVEIEVVR